MTCRKLLQILYLYYAGCIGPLVTWRRMSFIEKLLCLNLLGMLIWVAALCLVYSALVDANMECAVALQVRGIR